MRTLFFLVLSLSCCWLNAAEFNIDGRFSGKLPEHPRLFLTKEKEKEIQTERKNDPFLDKLVKELIAKADRVAQDPVTDYRIPDGKRLLGQSRRSIDRTSAFAFAYRMTREKKYLDKAVEEMLAVCRFKDWNPSHYLDTAEMATAVGVGYDWLYEDIPSEQREEIKDAIVKHALNTALPIYEKKGWWSTANNNWNEVCNAGLTIGALAVADEEPELAGKIVAYALKSIPNGLEAYKPDGAYPEGPVYWSYGASFTGLMLKVLDDVFHNDFDLLKSPGLNITGDYYRQVIGPNYRNFNYADAGSGAEASPMMFALSTFYDRPDYAVWLRTFLKRENRYRSGRLAVFHAIWYNPKGTDDDLAKVPLAASYSGIQDVCTMRAAWNEPNAAFVGFKGGNNRANHGHLDIGSFIYEVNGIRWAVDLGSDNYNMPGYFGKQRWDYFRLNNRSHNTLVIGGKIQNPAADCKIISFEFPNDGQTVARAVVDMSGAYKGQVRTAHRTAMLLKDGTFLVEDLLDGVNEPVRWAMATGAKIQLDRNVAVLSQNDKKLRIKITSALKLQEIPQFEVTSAVPPTDKENQNKGISILTSSATPQGGKVSFQAAMMPLP